jgi:hypothetical protein
MTEQPIPLDALSEARSQQLLGWLYASLNAGKVVDVAEWNRAVTTLSASAA